MSKTNAGYSLIASCRTDLGLVRKSNQDSIYYGANGNISVFCVADGMGGHTQGRFASEEITHVVREWTEVFSDSSYAGGFSQIIDDFEKCIVLTNERIYARFRDNAICGTTVVVMLVWKNQYAIFSVGDSRVYRKRRHDFDQLTRDDVWQNQPEVLKKHVPMLTLQSHPDYGKLTKAVGCEKGIIAPFRMTDKLRRRDVFLLCSDGVYKTCEENFLKQICDLSSLLGAEKLIERRSDQICERVREKGAPDNYSFIIVMVR